MQSNLQMRETIRARFPDVLNPPSDLKADAATAQQRPAEIDAFTTKEGALNPVMTQTAEQIPAALSKEAVAQTKSNQTQARLRPPSPQRSEPSQGDGAAEHAYHAAHIAHEVHLAAEGAEGAAHVAGHAGKYVKQVKVAQDFMRAHHQTGHGLRKMKQGINKLQNVVKNGGGVEATQKLALAKKAHEAANIAHANNKPVAKAAQDLLRTHAASAANKGHNKTMKIGAQALKLEKALKGSTMGTRLMAAGKVISHPSVAKGLMLVGAGVETYAGVVDSNAQTTGGKALNGALAGGAGALVMANPVVAIGDLALPEGYKLSELFRGTASVMTGMAEAAVTGDTTAMAKFHSRSKNGDYGVLLKASSEAGDYWNDNGVKGGLSKFWDSLKWQFSN